MSQLLEDAPKDHMSWIQIHHIGNALWNWQMLFFMVFKLKEEGKWSLGST